MFSIPPEQTESTEHQQRTHTHTHITNLCLSKNEQTDSSLQCCHCCEVHLNAYFQNNARTICFCVSADPLGKGVVVEGCSRGKGVVFHSGSKTDVVLFGNQIILSDE